MTRAVWVIFRLISIGIWGVLSTPFDAFAAPQCAKHADAIERLASKYKEFVVSRGVTHNGGLIEVLESEGGRTWSIIVTTQNGWSCLVAAGEGWRTQSPSPADPAI